MIETANSFSGFEEYKLKYIRLIFLLWLLFLSFSCGSAEPIKSYIYPVPKYQLETAVLNVLHSNPHIIIDTTAPPESVTSNPNNAKDTSTAIMNPSDYQGSDSAAIATNDKAVMQIKIKVGGIANDYVFRYRGDEQDWKRSASSVIFIQYAGDKQGNSISQGQNAHGEFQSKLAKGFTSLFEREVVSKIDNELNVKHTEQLGPLNDLH